MRFAGLQMLQRVRELGLSRAAVEAGGDVGGTWYSYRYPDARCAGTVIAKSYAHAQHARGETEGRETYLMGGTYTDALRRTPDGWRIPRRRFVCTWAAKGTDVMTPTHDRLTVGS